MRKVELLAPAKDLECGIAAVNHGADAVYIGAHRFGARAAAGNSVEDIAALCRHAHAFGVKVYVTVNTILYDSEIGDVRRLLSGLDKAGVDAVLVQDMAFMEFPEFSPSAAGAAGYGFRLHASTQTDNRTAEKVAWLRSLGFSRVVLARELSVGEIAEIHRRVPDIELEVFVHGALCVCYSGVCYASQHCFGRSSNRGECAQFCRLKFDLKDSDGREIERGRHLLSLRDMCRIDALDALMEAGVSSFKIEGRLKDVCYVKNVVAAYSNRLNEIIERNPGRYCRASRGRCTYTFTPDLRKTFNRGFTDYFLNGRTPDIVSFDTPKAMGEYVGKVKEIRGKSFSVTGAASFANGDGLCFIDEGHGLEGFRVNRVEGNRLFPLSMPSGLRPGKALYRNSDREFGRVLSKPSAMRKIPVRMKFAAVERGFSLSACGVEVTCDMERHPAMKPQHDNIVRQLAKLGGTPYACESVEIAGGADRYFIPVSELAGLRRRLTDTLARRMSREGREAHAAAKEREACRPVQDKAGVWGREYDRFPYMYNISNHLAARFYGRTVRAKPVPALELGGQGSQDGLLSGNGRPGLIMQCRHCLRYSLGRCVRYGGRKPSWREPLYLELPGRRTFRLEFDCKECQMNIYAE